ncbi:MAG TPA: hypothetical protein VGX51_00435 [Solirubrobacteraceae bacterium]|jgi:hypothetical protein|nr:hypothetical protein [Solirubrobacteraceae bacterium]
MPSAKSAARLKTAVPWTMLARLVMVLGTRWSALSGKERARLSALLRTSRGRVGNLNTRERAELRKLVRKLDLKGAGRELMPLFRAGGKRRKRG